jgi:hypothetical protein
MSVCVSFLVALALLLPSGMMELEQASENLSKRAVVADVDSSEPDTLTELEIEEPELFVSSGQNLASCEQLNDCVSLLSRNHAAAVDLDSSGCRPPPESC